jgi:hypothetical protein
MKSKLLATWMVATGLAAATALSGCGSATANDSPTASNSAASTTGATSPATAAAGKVSANTASESEIATALQAAGVANAARWAREVVEYRPYDANDATLTTLRQNLAKYNPGDDTLNKIVGALHP